MSSGLSSTIWPNVKERRRERESDVVQSENSPGTCGLSTGKGTTKKRETSQRRITLLTPGEKCYFDEGKGPVPVLFCQVYICPKVIHYTRAGWKKSLTEMMREGKWLHSMNPMFRTKHWAKLDHRKTLQPLLLFTTFAGRMLLNGQLCHWSWVTFYSLLSHLARERNSCWFSVC